MGGLAVLCMPATGKKDLGRAVSSAPTSTATSLSPVLGLPLQSGRSRSELCKGRAAGVEGAGTPSPTCSGVFQGASQAGR